jgi:hypothetical protein
LTLLVPGVLVKLQANIALCLLAAAGTAASISSD